MRTFWVFFPLFISVIVWVGMSTSKIQSSISSVARQRSRYRFTAGSLLERVCTAYHWLMACVDGSLMFYSSAISYRFRAIMPVSDRTILVKNVIQL